MGKFEDELNHLRRTLCGQVDAPASTAATLHQLSAADAWRPVPGQCHDNVDRWVLLHEGDRPQRGWLHQPFADLPYRFVAHSVVLTRSGNLLDVTLGPSATPYRFLPHPRDTVGFFALLIARPDASILAIPTYTTNSGESQQKYN